MNLVTITRRITVVVAMIATLTALAGSALAANARPVGMSTAAYRALVLQSEALNQKYKLGAYRQVHEGMTATEYRALMLRSEALNRKYGLGAQKVPVAASAPTTSTRGFGWAAFGIGAATMLGLVLLATGFLARGRYTGRARPAGTSS